MVATMLEIAGAKPLVGCEGRSVVAQAQAGPDHKDTQKGKEAIFSEVVGHSMVKTDRWKTAVDAKTKQPVELFDEVNDPNELRNLVNEPALEKVRQELGERYINHLLSHMDLAKFEAWEKRRQGRVISGTRMERQAEG
jgi:arylsulfatase A-like enzyme